MGVASLAMASTAYQMSFRDRWVSLLLVCLPCEATPAQADDEVMRVTLRYAKAAVRDVRRVVFVVPDSLPTDPSDSRVRPWARAFQEAGLPLISDLREPGMDTLGVTISPAQRDSVTALGTFYTIRSAQAYCVSEGGGSGLMVDYAICNSRSCRFRYQMSTSVGILCRSRR